MMAEDKLKRDYIRLPNTSAQPEYVYNKVKQTVSGHRFEVDDTPDHERILDGHKSGSYREYSSDGKIVDVSVANRHEYTKGSRTVTIDGFDDVITQGSKLIVKGRLPCGSSWTI